MTRRTRLPTTQDIEAWHAFAADVQRFPVQNVTGETLVAQHVPISSAAIHLKPLPTRTGVFKPATLNDLHRLDRRNAQRFKQGAYRIDARLDLHGMTMIEAHDRLRAFLQSAYAQQYRCVLVITGKGRRTAEAPAGVLRQAVPVWLAESPLAPMITAVTQAQAKDGGTGAYYVLLKRQRSLS